VNKFVISVKKTKLWMRVKIAGWVLGVGVLAGMAAVAAVDAGGRTEVVARAPLYERETITQSTAPPTLATPIARPTHTAPPYGNEGCIGKDCFPLDDLIPVRRNG
jgi:hypothetical protein